MMLLLTTVGKGGHLNPDGGLTFMSKTTALNKV